MVRPKISRPDRLVLRKRNMRKSDVPFFVRNDAEIYPIVNHKPAEVTEENVKSWFFDERLKESDKEYHVSTHREFSVLFEMENEEHQREAEVKQNTTLVNGIAAMCVILPFNEHGFKKLMNGDVFETTADPLHDFFRAERIDLSDPSRTNHGDTKIGFHVWVIDKFLNGIYGLYKMMLNHISEAMKKMREKVPNLEVIGFSGYTVSYDGVSLFYNKLNCMERAAHVADEHVLVRDRPGHKKERIVYKTDEMKDITRLVRDEGWAYRNRCKMMVTYPGEISLVWIFLDAKPKDKDS